VKYLLLFLEFFKIGLFSFGGGYGMLPLMEETAVGREWITSSQFFDFVGVAESTPGPIAINMATFIGASQAGILGSFLATLGVVLPSFIIILLIAAVLKNLTDNRFFAGFMKGVKPVVTGLILSTGTLLLLRSAVSETTAGIRINWFSLIVFAVVAAAAWASQKFRKKKLTAIPIILISAAIGIIATFLRQT
jgi:chromate transporter